MFDMSRVLLCLVFVYLGFVVSNVCLSRVCYNISGQYITFSKKFLMLIAIKMYGMLRTRLLWPAAAVVVLLAGSVSGNPDAKRLYDDLLSNYNRLIRPVANNTDKITVKMGLKLSQLVDLVSIIFIKSLCLVSKVYHILSLSYLLSGVCHVMGLCCLAFIMSRICHILCLSCLVFVMSGFCYDLC